MECNKCDDRGMIADSKYSSHSCSCGKHNRIMAERFKGWSLEDLVAFKEMRLRQKGKI